MDTLFTIQDWKRLPEGFPAQLFDGCLVREASPTYWHQQLVGRIYATLIGVLDQSRVVMSPTDVVIDRLNVVQPDVCVVQKPPPRDSHDIGIPVLAFEVLSPTTRRRDRTVKTVKLLAAGVEEVWLVDPADRTISVCATGGTLVLRAADEARSSVLPDVRLVPRDLFEDESQRG